MLKIVSFLNWMMLLKIVTVFRAFRARVLTSKMVFKMNEQPIIFALANPDPEINPADALKVAPNALIATGRSDYPNQVNNVLCFPFIFRGALMLEQHK